MKALSTADAAARLDITPMRVRQLIAEGRLPAQKVGRDYVIQPADLSKVRDRKPGRPKKGK